MSVELFTDGVEPADSSEVWRFMSLAKFRDLLETDELYLRRSDLLSDEHEGMPPEEWVRRGLGLDGYDILDNETLNAHLGSLAQDRQAFFVSCWHLHEQETALMWGRYGSGGVAVVACYAVLRAVLNEASERFYVSKIRYGWEQCRRYNVQSFITTKRRDYEAERELRIGAWITNSGDGGNRHIDLNNRFHARPLFAPPSRLPEGIRRRIDVSKMVTEVVLNPGADQRFASDVSELVAQRLDSRQLVRPSALAAHSHLIPTAEELRLYGFDRTPAAPDPVPHLPRLPEPPSSRDSSG